MIKKSEPQIMKILYHKRKNLYTGGIRLMMSDADIKEVRERTCIQEE